MKIALLGGVPLFDDKDFVEHFTGMRKINYNPELKVKGVGNQRGYIPCPKKRTRKL